MTAKILHLDIETAPNIAAVWGMWEQNAIWFESEWYMLTWAAKWHGEDHVYYNSLHHHPEFNGDHRNDRPLVETLIPYLHEADIIVGQNVDKFDLRKIKARCLEFGIKPPRPYKTVDTLKVARKHFALNSYSLDNIAKMLKVGRKMPTGGKQLWKDCFDGNRRAFEKMLAYNIEDVELLERVYTKLLPWTDNHPGLGVYAADTGKPICRNCGEDKLKSDGYAYLSKGKYQAYLCKSCGKWQRDTTNLLTKEHRKNITMGVIS